MENDGQCVPSYFHNINTMNKKNDHCKATLKLHSDIINLTGQFRFIEVAVVQGPYP